MFKVLLNNKKYEVVEKKKKYLIYQYCYEKGEELPCFCYNENLEIAGNCRICLVEVSTSPKLVLACATTLINNMVIQTQTKRLEKVRKSIIEFLLINHPLDCPICDQGGECDLQNISKKNGLDRGRFYEFKKRSVLDKESGFFIKTIMTRCIHCTRCVRFYKEVEGTAGFGIVARGESTEIVAKKENLLSILSGNVIDLCPVGALTSKAYTFKSRPWELNKYENIDILDSMCSSLNLDIRNNKIIRILPVSDSILNTDWISNITRYFFDSLYVQRLTKPFLLLKNTFIDLSWLLVTKLLLKGLLGNILKNNNIGFFLYDFVDLQSLLYLKNLNNKLGFSNIGIFKKIYVNKDFNFFYFFNTDYLTLSNSVYFFFLVLNLRLKMPVLNSKLRLLLKKKNIMMYSLGFTSFDVSFIINNLGNTLHSFLEILENKSKMSLAMLNSTFFFNKIFSFFNYKFMNYLVGEVFFYVFDNFKLLQNLFFFFNISLNNLYCIFSNTISLGLNELNVTTFNYINTFFFYNFYPFSNKFLKKKKNSFSILQNFFFNKNLKDYNLILPISSFFEYNGEFLNFEGRLRKKLKSYIFSFTLKANFEILKYFQVILNNLKYFKQFNYLKYFFNFFFFDNFFSFEKLFYGSKILNYKFYYNYNVILKNIIIFESDINIYKFKNFYKYSKILGEAAVYYNTYKHVFS